MNIDDRKRIALEFLAMAREGNRAAAERLLAPGAKHHNAYVAAGMPALLDAMVAAAATATDRTMDVKRVVGEGDQVVVHSHVRHGRGEPGVAVVHIFRFEGDRIAELWDLGQAVAKDSPNADGTF